MILPVFFALLVGVLSAPHQFEVKSLPGWTSPLPSKWYSGFVDGGPPPGANATSMTFHWVFVESEVNPAEDPILVWYNGGPGASSMFGLMVELGPLLLNQESLANDEYKKTGIPQLQYNDWGWTKLANVLVLENPPPVGYSYCEPAGPEGQGTSCGPWNDSTVATANGYFFENWFALFPEYAQNDMYITGESYAGVYVPIVVQELLENHPSIGAQLVGYAVGDGCMGNEVLCGNNEQGQLIVNIANGPYYEIMFMFGHGQVSIQMFDNIMATCPVANLKSGQGLSAACQALIAQMYTDLGGYFTYDLYDNCPSQIYKRKRQHNNIWPYPPFPGPGFPCAGDALPIWMNLTETKAALNVQADAFWFNADDGDGFSYTPSLPSVLPFYNYVITATDLRVLIYNGDADPSLNSFVTQAHFFNYFAQVGLNQTQTWRPWTLDGQQSMGGYVVKYGDNFAFATIRGAGHMVPEYAPPQAFAMLTAFLGGNDFLSYVPPQQ